MISISSRLFVRLAKVIFCVSTACFILAQLHIAFIKAPTEKKFSTEIDSDSNAESSNNNNNNANLPVVRNYNNGAVVDDRRRIVAPIQIASMNMPQGPKEDPKFGVRDDATNLNNGAGLPSKEDIKRTIDFNNAHAEVLNQQKFGPLPSDLSFVIVIQVHDRANYLRKLIDSFRVARHIEKVLLIFSHDFYSQEINAMVASIDFCRVIQIFYPYSMQLFPDRFPGEDPRDCSPTISKAEAKRVNCLNWEHPDKYGHYRVAKITQIKHHWWWKINYVFDGIPAISNYTGWVLFLEEDHYVSPDFLHVLDFTVKNKASLCQECSVISLGFYLKSYISYPQSIDKLSVYPWFSSRHNMGMSINREIWLKIKSCSELFCKYDDYNWDWSLMHVNLKCLSSPMFVIYAKAPRVFHIGDCGLHHKGKQCTADTSATKVTEILKGVSDKLYPKELTVSERSRRTLKAPKENGGWGDIRDHNLCYNHTIRS